jgi:uncharacterized protein RhaS with RHS repeats
MGRWTCKDPIGFGGGQANIYEYISNDPLQYSDESGLGRFGTRPLFLGNDITSNQIIVIVPPGYPIGTLYSETAFLDPLNLQLAHEGYITNSGEIIGFFDDNGGEIKYSDPRGKVSDYNLSGEEYDDECMKQAIKNIKDRFTGKYSLLGPLIPGKYNCQDFATAARKEYNRLMSLNRQ